MNAETIQLLLEMAKEFPDASCSELAEAFADMERADALVAYSGDLAGKRAFLRDWLDDPMFRPRA